MKAVRIRYYEKDENGEDQTKLTGMIKKTQATEKLLKRYNEKYGKAEYVDFDEVY